MQHSLDEAMELELYEEIEKDMSNQVGTSLEMATEMPEPENKLDGEELTEDITGTMGEPDHLIVRKFAFAYSNVFIGLDRLWRFYRTT